MRDARLVNRSLMRGSGVRHFVSLTSRSVPVCRPDRLAARRGEGGPVTAWMPLAITVSHSALLVGRLTGMYVNASAPAPPANRLPPPVTSTQPYGYFTSVATFSVNANVVTVAGMVRFQFFAAEVSFVDRIPSPPRSEPEYLKRGWPSGAKSLTPSAFATV